MQQVVMKCGEHRATLIQEKISSYIFTAAIPAKVGQGECQIRNKSYLNSRWMMPIVLGVDVMTYESSMTT